MSNFTFTLNYSNLEFECKVGPYNFAPYNFAYKIISEIPFAT